MATTHRSDVEQTADARTAAQRSRLRRRASRSVVPSRPAEFEVDPLEVGQSVGLADLEQLEIVAVTQRNWSRVAVARRGEERFFVKQFVDRVGSPHHRGFIGDYKTADELGDELLPGLHVVPVLARDDERLVNVFPFIEMTTIDSIAHGRSSHREPATRVGEALAAILETRGVPNRPDDVAVWKGLDPKNIGWSPDGRLWIFDFGPPKVITRESAAARVMAAGLLSRWVARPGRHLVWPERSILRGVCEPIVPYAKLEAVEAELHDHQELRMREPQRRGAAATATRLGLQTLGRVHWAAVVREARHLYAQE